MAASILNDMLKGLKTQLETQITGLRGYIHDIEPNQTPAAVCKLRAIDPDLTLGGSSFAGTLTIEVLLTGTDIEGSMDQLEEFMSPIGDRSIEAAIDSDNTLGGKADDVRLDSIQNIGRHPWPGGAEFIGADFLCRFVVQELT